MHPNTTETNQSQAESTKAGGCCGGHGKEAAADARPEGQAERTKSGGCCCGKGSNES